MQSAFKPQLGGELQLVLYIHPRSAIGQVLGLKHVLVFEVNIETCILHINDVLKSFLLSSFPGQFFQCFGWNMHFMEFLVISRCLCTIIYSCHLFEEFGGLRKYSKLLSHQWQ